MKTLFATSEVYPLAKTGGLADVSAGLPAALAQLGVDVRLVMPGYAQALDRAIARQPSVRLGTFLGHDVSVISARTPGTDLPVWLVDCPALFKQRKGLYMDEAGHEWPDNALRFAVLSHATVALARQSPMGWAPDVVHINDWHLGMVPALLAAGPQGGAPPTVLTIHNLAFQGVFPIDLFPALGLPERFFPSMEFFGKFSFLKAGISFADRLTTVSPSYAREILTPEFGCGLDGLLRTRSRDLTGILNGIDYESWTPEDPVLVPFPYNATDVSGKQMCKTALQTEFGLQVDPDVPVIAFMSRLTEQKMADSLLDIIPLLPKLNAQLAICGEGDQQIERRLRDLAGSHADHLAVRIGYEEPLARRMLAGADMLAAPSRFEPCGLIQMYAMCFGTLPIVRNVGGLADTVVGHNDDPPKVEGKSTGFVFDEPTARSLAGAIDDACRVYRDPSAWRSMQIRAMAQDFRWRRSAQLYLELYESLTGSTKTQNEPAQDADIEALANLVSQPLSAAASEGVRLRA